MDKFHLLQGLPSVFWAAFESRLDEARTLGRWSFTFWPIPSAPAGPCPSGARGPLCMCVQGTSLAGVAYSMFPETSTPPVVHSDELKCVICLLLLRPLNKAGVPTPSSAHILLCFPLSASLSFLICFHSHLLGFNLSDGGSGSSASFSSRKEAVPTPTFS